MRAGLRGPGAKIGWEMGGFVSKGGFAEGLPSGCSRGVGFWVLRYEISAFCCFLNKKFAKITLKILKKMTFSFINCSSGALSGTSISPAQPQSATSFSCSQPSIKLQLSLIPN